MTGLATETGNKAHALDVRRNDLYETPREAVLSLLAVERLPHLIWEPACGPGAIVSVLRERGHEVIATDLVDYASPHQDYAGIDFLIPGMGEHIAPSPFAIVTNPPFKNAPAFVRRALALSPYVAMLLRLAFITGTTRNDILDMGPLARVHVFSKRLPMMHRDGWTGPKASASMDFAWFIWQRGHNGPPELRRVNWRDHT